MATLTVVCVVPVLVPGLSNMRCGCKMAWCVARWWDRVGAFPLFRRLSPDDWCATAEEAFVDPAERPHFGEHVIVGAAELGVKQDHC